MVLNLHLLYIFVQVANNGLILEMNHPTAGKIAVPGKSLSPTGILVTIDCHFKQITTYKVIPKTVKVGPDAYLLDTLSIKEIDWG